MKGIRSLSIFPCILRNDIDSPRISLLGPVQWSSRQGNCFLCGIILLHLLLVIFSNFSHSPNNDEVGHLAAGVSHWKLGRFDLYVVNPPLVRLIASAAILPTRPSLDWHHYSTRSGERKEIEVGRDFVTINKDRILWLYGLARTACAPFSVIGALAVYRLALGLYGVNAACAASALWCLSPSILAYASTLNPDVPAAAFFALLMAELLDWVKFPSTTRALRIGVVSGLALSTKLTFVLLLPLLLPLVMFIRTRHSSPQTPSATILVHAGLVAGVALLLLNSAYFWHDVGRPLSEVHWESDLMRRLTAAQTPGKASDANDGESSLVQSIQMPLPRSFLQGIDIQRRDFELGYTGYLMGEFKHGGWWHYYAIALITKETLPFLFLLLTSLCVMPFGSSTRNLDEIVVLIAAVVTWVVVSAHASINLHARYMLPAYPLLFVLAAGAVARRMALRRLWPGLLACQAAVVLYFAPHWMSYFNVLAGGPTRGHYWLLESSIDWGQDLSLLRDWQLRHPQVANLHCALHTVVDPRDFGIAFTLPPTFKSGRPDITAPSGKRGPHAGTYAISVSHLRGVNASVPDGCGGWHHSDGHFAYFRECFTPADMVGYSIYIYRVSEDQAAEARQMLMAHENQSLASENE